jgi:large subunit ribosomal protein L10
VQNRNEKAETIKTLGAKFQRAQVAIVAEYNKLDVATVTELRKKMRAQQIDYQVVKNTLAKLAAKGTSLEKLEDILAGPTALVLGYADPVAPAKVLQDFLKDLKDKESLKIRGAVVNGNRVDAKGVEALAKMPGLPELRGTLLRMLNTPATQLVRVLAAPGQQLARVIQAHVDKQEKPAETPAS